MHASEESVIERRYETYERRHRRRLSQAIIASVIMHVLILMLIRGDVVLPPSPFAAAGPRSGDPHAAAGGGMKVVAMQFRAVPPPPAPVVPEPVPVPIPVQPEIRLETPKLETAAVPVPVAGDLVAAAGEGKGTATGQGLADGKGKGDGGTGEEGLFRVVPPSPRGLILPPSDRPGKVRGREVGVWVFVTDRGQVVADSTRVHPTSGDKKFDDRLKKQAAEWVFEPARRGGRAVAEWFRYTVIL
jgi:hypothetical protein